MEKREKMAETAERLLAKIKKGRSCTSLIPAIVVAAAAVSLVGTYHPKVFDSLASELSQVEAAEAAKEAEGLLELPDQEDKTADGEDTDVTDGAAYKDGTYYGEAQGFGGITKVQVVITEGKIASIEVVSHSDDSPYIDKAKGLIDQIISGQTTKIDTVSGATYSSKGILNAVRKALAQAATDPSLVEAVAEQQTPGKTTPSGSASISKVEDADHYKDGTYYGTGQGFGGTTKVKVVISGGKITDIEVVSHNDDSPYIGNAKTLINKMISAQSTNVDAVSGATYSSRGIINAVRSALAQASMNDENVEFLPDDDLAEGVENTASGNKKPNIDTDSLVGASGYKDGTYTGEGEGYLEGLVHVKVTIQEGKIKKVEVLDYEYDGDAYMEMAKGLIPGILSKQSPDVDTISGATYSSKGIIEGVYQALKQAAAANESDTSKPSDSQKPGNGNQPVEGDKTESGSSPEETLSGTGSAYEHVYRTPEDDEDESVWDEYGITVTIQVENGVFKDITVTPDETYNEIQNKAYFKKATTGKTGFITKYKNAAATKETVESWDVKTGATRTSTAIRAAVRNALEKIAESN